MTERLAEIAARVDGIRQLGAVVNAMRGIAAARAQQARGQLASVDSYAATIVAAIGQSLALQPRDRADNADRGAGLALVLFCAEQGFAGAFSERILEAAGPDLTSCGVYLIGTRGGTLARERGLMPEWMSAMPSHSAGIPNWPTASSRRLAKASQTARSAGSTWCSATGSQAMAITSSDAAWFPSTRRPSLPKSTRPLQS